MRGRTAASAIDLDADSESSDVEVLARPPARWRAAKRVKIEPASGSSTPRLRTDASTSRGPERRRPRPPAPDLGGFVLPAQSSRRARSPSTDEDGPPPLVSIRRPARARTPAAPAALAPDFDIEPHTEAQPSTSTKIARKTWTAYARPNQGDNAQGFGTVGPGNRWGFREPFIERFPVLDRRNFFIVQYHWATSKHYDLRLQCAFEIEKTLSGGPWLPDKPGTFSWAVPLGLGGLEPGRWRLAVQTPKHTVCYTEFEGGFNKPTMIYCIGYYRIVLSRSAYLRGDDLDPDTDDEDFIAGKRDGSGEHHEQLLARGMRKGRFVIEFHGERFTQRFFFLRLSEVNYPTKTVYGPDGKKYTPSGPDDPNWRRVAHPVWIFRLASSAAEADSWLNEDRTPSIGQVSIWSGRDMETIRAHGATAQGRRELDQAIASHRRHFDGPTPKPDPRFQQVGGDGFETDDEIDVAATLEEAAFREGNALVRDV